MATLTHPVAARAQGEPDWPTDADFADEPGPAARLAPRAPAPRPEPAPPTWWKPERPAPALLDTSMRRAPALHRGHPHLLGLWATGLVGSAVGFGLALLLEEATHEPPDYDGYDEDDGLGRGLRRITFGFLGIALGSPVAVALAGLAVDDGRGDLGAAFLGMLAGWSASILVSLAAGPLGILLVPLAVSFGAALAYEASVPSEALLLERPRGHIGWP